MLDKLKKLNVGFFNIEKDYSYIFKAFLLLVVLGVFMDNPGNSLEFNMFQLDDAVRLNLRPPIIMLGGILLGPTAGALAGGLIDIISYNIWHSDLDYILVLTFITMFRGFLSGYIFHNIFAELNAKSVISAVSLPHVITSGFAIPTVLCYYYDISLFNNILLRLAIQSVFIPLYIISIYYIVKGIKKTQDFKILHNKMKKMLKRDHLTGLYNRKYFMEYLSKMISLSYRKSHPLVVVMIDLDKFKDVNDKYGHLVGDEVLKKIGELLKNEMRTEDIVARMGGEEFAVLLFETTIERGIKVSERIRQKIAELKFTEKEINVTASFGVAQLKEGDDQKTILIRADRALYRSKENGRNMVSSLK